jgi:GNAT superfamily N-acetyltransferase
MFNTWDELWLGGFTQGVPFTEERVKKIYSKMRALALLVALDKKIAKPIGFCSLYQHWKDEDAAYIGLLGVSPEALDRKVGKRLLLRAMAISIEGGFSRVDLHTWAGNLRAVPLYKKIGLMWNPEMDGVHLEGFIPAILSHPLCAPFFEGKDPEAWYNLQERELSQAPDDIDAEGMSVYEYRFVEDDDSLEVTVDRLSKNITGVSRKRKSGDLCISANVENHLTLCGVPSIYTLRIQNNTSADVSIAVSLTGFNGLNFDDKSKLRSKIEAGNSLEWNVHFHLDATAEIFRKEQKAPTITAHLNVDGTDSELKTGLRVYPVAEIRTRWGACKIAPSGKVELPITVVSRASEGLRGQLRFESMDVPLIVTPSEAEINLAPEGLDGALFQITADAELEPGTYDLQAFLELKESDIGKGRVALETRRFRIPVYCLVDGTTAIGEDDRQRRVVIVGQHFNARIEREGGMIRLTDSDSATRTTLRLWGEIGPPFGINPFRNAEREVEATETDNETIVSLKAHHPDRPLQVEDRLIIPRNSNTVRHEIWVTNTGDEAHELQQRFNGAGGGFDIAASLSEAIMPLSSGIVKASAGNFLFAYPAIPSDPAVFAEQWIAVNTGSRVVGQIWSPENVEEVRIASGNLSRIQYNPIHLEPGETRCTSRVWNVIGAPDWETVRRRWKSIISREYDSVADVLDSQEVKSFISIDINPVIVPSPEATTASFKITKSIAIPLTGNLRLEAPDGWRARTKGVGDSKETLSIPDFLVDDEDAFEFTLEPDKGVSEGFDVKKGKVILETPVDHESYFTLVQLGSSKSAVTVEEREEEGLKTFKVSNGISEFSVSPEFGGCLYSLKNSRNVELLASSFPESSPREFIENFYGGVQPVVWDDEMDEDLMKARTNEEEMKAEVVEIGATWKGVEITWKSTIQKTCRGAEFRMQYLTAPGSPLILVRLKMMNTTNAPMNFIPSLFVYPAIDNDLKSTALQARMENRRINVRPSQTPAIIMPESNFSWLHRDVEDDAIDGLGVLVAGSARRSWALHLGAMAITGGLDLSVWLKPGEETEFNACLVVDPVNGDVLEDLQKVLDDII